MTQLTLPRRDLIINREITVPHILDASGRPLEIRVLPAKASEVRPYHDMVSQYTEANGGVVGTDWEPLPQVLEYMKEGPYLFFALQTPQGKPVAAHVVELATLKSVQEFNADTSEDGGQQYVSLERAVKRACQAGFDPKKTFMGFNYQCGVAVPEQGLPDSKPMARLISVINDVVFPQIVGNPGQLVGTYIETYTGEPSRKDRVSLFNGVERKSHIAAGFDTVLMGNEQFHPPALDGSGRVDNLELKGSHLLPNPLVQSAAIASYITITYCDGGAGDLIQRASSLRNVAELDAMLRAGR